MAVSRLSQTTLQNAFQKYNNLWDGRSAVGGMDAIGSVLVPSAGAASITFSNIPQTYSHLQIRLIAASSNNLDVFYQFNGDTGNNYTKHYLYGSGSSAVGGATVPSNSGSLGYVSATSNTSVYGGAIWDLLDYTNTSKYKTTRSLTGYAANSSGLLVFYSGLWSNTAAVTSITIFPNPTSNFAQYTTASLYGIK